MKSPQALMIQGTTSDAGKSVLVAAVCRILARRGLKVAPFKPQNMALNSAVAVEGGEIGRAQAVQAEAAFLSPSILMNPVLLKPNSDIGAQVIVHGKPIGNMQAQFYHQHKPRLLKEVLTSFEQLQQEFQAVIIEGAGSPAEINLRDRDIANMGFAEAADCPVIIVADIDRGGVFAHLVGTYELLSDSEKQRVKGFVINRFRGDIALLQGGLDWLEQRCGVPVLGVIPYIHDLYIEAEDAIDKRSLHTSKNSVNIVAIATPKAGNHTDMDALRMHPQVNFTWLRDVEQFAGADVLILPGSKQVCGDLQWLKETGWHKAIEKHLRYGGKLMGLCGGFQMLGHSISDPDAIESEVSFIEGLGYLDFTTVLAPEKITRDVFGEHLASGKTVTGYEIHHGRSQGPALSQAVFRIADEKTPSQTYGDGALSADGQILGSYIHGLFNEPDFLDELLAWAGLESGQSFNYQQFREQQFNRLADVVEEAIPLDKWLELLSLTGKVI